MVKITSREEVIMKMIRLGISYKEMSLALGLSVHTIHGYVRDLFLKFNVSNKIELLNEVDKNVQEKETSKTASSK